MLSYLCEILCGYLNRPKRWYTHLPLTDLLRIIRTFSRCVFTPPATSLLPSLPFASSNDCNKGIRSTERCVFRELNVPEGIVCDFAHALNARPAVMDWVALCIAMRLRHHERTTLALTSSETSRLGRNEPFPF